MTAMPPRNFDPFHFCITLCSSKEERSQWIAVAAYYKAQRRGFVPGYEAQDWREAEREIEIRIADMF
jgi:hypothetical protein